MDAYGKIDQARKPPPELLAREMDAHLDALAAKYPEAHLLEMRITAEGHVYVRVDPVA